MFSFLLVAVTFFLNLTLSQFFALDRSILNRTVREIVLLADNNPIQVIGIENPSMRNFSTKNLDIYKPTIAKHIKEIKFEFKLTSENAEQFIAIFFDGIQIGQITVRNKRLPLKSLEFSLHCTELGYFGASILTKFDFNKHEIYFIFTGAVSRWFKPQSISIASKWGLIIRQISIIDSQIFINQLKDRVQSLNQTNVQLKSQCEQLLQQQFNQCINETYPFFTQNTSTNLQASKQELWNSSLQLRNTTHKYGLLNQQLTQYKRNSSLLFATERESHAFTQDFMNISLGLDNRKQELDLLKQQFEEYKRNQSLQTMNKQTELDALAEKLLSKDLEFENSKTMIDLLKQELEAFKMNHSLQLMTKQREFQLLQQQLLNKSLELAEFNQLQLQGNNQNYSLVGRNNYTIFGVVSLLLVFMAVFFGIRPN